MVAFKITDVRVRRNADATVNVYIDGLGTGVRLQPQVDQLRSGLMLAVFALGRDCYWDDSRVFSTTLAPWVPSPSPLNEGRVASWDVRIPETAGQPEFFLSLLSRDETRPTSGNPAPGWAILQVPQRDAPTILALLRSKYCYYAAGSLRNTEIVTDFG